MASTLSLSDGRYGSRILHIPSHILAAAIEALFLTNVFPERLPAQNAFLWAFMRTFALHFAFILSYIVFYLGLIYPYFVSPIRHFPTPSASTSPLARISRGMFTLPPGTRFWEWSKDTDNDGVLLLRSPLHRNRLLLTSPRALADVLLHNSYDFEKPKGVRSFLRSVLGDGLIIIEGEEHKFQRRHVMPAFSFRHIKELYPMMWRKSLALTERLNFEAIEGKTIEMYSWASKVTLDIIGIAGLGREINALQNSDDELVRCYEELLEPSPQKLVFFVAQAYGPAKLVKMLPLRLNRVFSETTSTLRSICGRLVREKREAIKTNADDHFDILSILIKSNDFSDDALVDQLLTFLAAGHETTSSTFTWLTFLLALHPNVQSRVREEVRQALPGRPAKDTDVDLSAVLESLPYLNGACNETLRLYPTVPITVRTSVRETRILDRPIPSGTNVIICPWAVNRNPKLWGPDAGEFKPERWIDDGKPNNSGGADSNYSNLTFLHGPRSCIGQNFAKAELRCLLAAFVGAFEWTMIDEEKDIIPAGVVTIKPRNGLHLRLRPLP
ncbi:putative P450 monooxygenase [Rhizodiscina lignyota]|uniref:P450 monooxygenase n=1 Tax=Rhizodiscina lignyota TaxID=1504668 RepID=A0A9P4MAI5_9PEZI|nr:putative P450 monooxygenase [Rhizodiscina lignyota]